jgi:hypothetical protein
MLSALIVRNLNSRRVNLFRLGEAVSGMVAGNS